MNGLRYEKLGEKVWERLQTMLLCYCDEDYIKALDELDDGAITFYENQNRVIITWGDKKVIE
jgi:hypothetical protein